MGLDTVTTLLAVRHGETAWNRERRIQGHLDVPLSPLGEAQAQRLAEVLAGEPIDAIYASDLMRARQTAAAIAARSGLPVGEDIGLRERGFGCFEGLSWTEIEARWPEQVLRWKRRDPDFGAEGGERLRDFYQRAVGAVERLAQAHPGQTLLLVAHGGVMDCLYRAGRRLPLEAPRNWALGNATINRLLYTPAGLSVVGWNDDLHLDGLGLDEAAA